MPKFTCIVTRDTTESIIVEVEAENDEQAESAAIEASQDPAHSWERDYTPNASSDHYVTNTEESE